MSLCPPGRCAEALQDGAIVYGHQVLPGDLADGLPAIDHSWGDFGGDLGPTGDAVGEADVDASATPGGGSTTQTTAIDLGDDGFSRWRGLDPDDRSAVGQFNAFDKSISAIDAGPAVHFIHVALPHYPWTLTPWGTSLTRFPKGLGDDRDAPGFERVVEMGYQMHSLQVGAVDVAVGRLIDQLEETGAWEGARWSS